LKSKFCTRAHTGQVLHAICRTEEHSTAIPLKFYTSFISCVFKKKQDEKRVEMQEHNAAVADRNARQRLMQTILDLGNKAFNPDIPVDNENAQAKKAQARREFDDLIQRQAKASS